MRHNSARGDQTALKNTIIYLIGFPGVGKLTTARILCQKTGAKLVDNHMINNPVFSIIGADGVTPIPEAAWIRVRQIRDVVFDTMVNVSPPEFSFVLTNVLIEKKSDKR